MLEYYPYNTDTWEHTITGKREEYLELSEHYFDPTVANTDESEDSP